MQTSFVPGRPSARRSANGHPVDDSEDGPLVLARAVLATAQRYSGRLLAWLLFCVVLASIYALTITPSFTASALLLLEPGRSPAALERSGATEAPALDIYRAESEIEVIKSERLLAYVFDTLGRGDGNGEPILQSQLSGSPTSDSLRAKLKAMLGLGEDRTASQEQIRQYAFAEFVRRIGVRRVGQSYVVEVSFTASDPTLARRATNAIVSAYLWQSVVVKSDAARSGGEFLQGRVNSLTAQYTAAAKAVADGELPQEPTPDADARVIGAALQPLAPSAPRTKLIAAFGGVLGVLSGLFAIVVAYAFDRRIYTPQAVSRATGLPCLASVPVARTKGRMFNRRLDDVSVSIEHDIELAVRDLRTAIGIVCPSNQVPSNRVVAFVGWTSEVGCSFLCRRFARLIRDAGSAALLIDTDLRRAPRGDDALAGSDGTSSLADALKVGIRPTDVRFTMQGGVAILPARSANPAINDFADLSSRKMGELFDHARKQGSVVVDLAPLNSTVDSKAVAMAVDAVVLVARARRTTIDDLASAVSTLQDVGANVVGVVLTGVSGKRRAV